MGSNSNTNHYLLKLSNSLIFLVLLLLAFLLRGISFFPSLINHDESTYIVIADGILKGQIYFIDLVDTKPIGIFLIYALLQKLVGGSIFMLRLCTTLFLVATAFFLVKVKIKMDGAYNGAIAAGVIYLFINSIFTFYGVSPNTEIFFNFFTILGLYLFTRLNQNPGYFFLAGLILGLGFLVKYVVMFDGIAFGLFLLLDSYKERYTFIKALGNCFIMALGATIPIVCVMICYYQMSALETFLFYSFEATSRYPKSVSFLTYIIFTGDYLLRFIPITLFFGYALFHHGISVRVRQLGGIWALLVLIIVLIPGNKFGHYFVHFSLPFSFLAGSFFSLVPEHIPRWSKRLFQPKIGYPVLILILILNLVFQKIDYWDKPDYPREIAAFLEPRLEPEDQIYVTTSSHILYHLLDKESPIKFVHPSLTWEQKHISALEIDIDEQTRRIVENPPKFIIHRDSPPNDRLDAFLDPTV